MIYRIIATKRFDKDIKMYQKKFRNVGEDVKKVVDDLKVGNLVGDVIKDLKEKENINNKEILKLILKYCIE